MPSDSQIHPYWHREIVLKLHVQHEQFIQWLRTIFYVNDFLHKEYDSIYQQYYYILLYELLTEGITYMQKAIDSVESVDNNPEWLKIIHCSLSEIKTSFSVEEFNFIEYKRHNSSHIFQNSYELIQDSGKIKTERKNNDLFQVKNQIRNVLKKYGSDYDFDKHLTSKLYPLIHKLYNDLQNLRDQEIANKSNFLDRCL